MKRGTATTSRRSSKRPFGVGCIVTAFFETLISAGLFDLRRESRVASFVRNWAWLCESARGRMSFVAFADGPVADFRQIAWNEPKNTATECFADIWYANCQRMQLASL